MISLERKLYEDSIDGLASVLCESSRINEEYDLILQKESLGKPKDIEKWHKDLLAWMKKYKLKPGAQLKMSGGRLYDPSKMAPTKAGDEFEKLLKRALDLKIGSEYNFRTGGSMQTSSKLAVNIFNSADLVFGEYDDLEYAGGDNTYDYCKVENEGAVSIIDRNFVEKFIEHLGDDTAYVIPSEINNQWEDFEELAHKANGSAGLNPKFGAMIRFKAVELFEVLKKLDGIKISLNNIKKSKNNPKYYSTVEYRIEVPKIVAFYVSVKSQRLRDGSFRVNAEAELDIKPGRFRSF